MTGPPTALLPAADKSLADVQVLVEGLDGKAAAGTAQQIHDLYQSYLDQAARNAKGTTPCCRC
jgi:predicted metalloendopeptidase